ncbi:MAG: hypothetical protein KC440_03140 [Nitrosarchaeum sp.]|nr:hypothetical protein [Nitrosarchaeum sp.]
MISKDNIDDEELSHLCDIVENTLESIVIQFRGHFFEEGMENKLRSQFESRLAILIEKKGYNFKNLPSQQTQYIETRILKALDLFKKEYES